MSFPQGFFRQRAGHICPSLDARQPSADAVPGWGASIRALYDGVVREPVPADLLKLLDELGKKAAK